MSEPVRWHAVADAEALRHAASERILASAARAIREHGRFAIALSGGETPRGVYERLRTARADWAAWHVWFGDERCLPRGDPGRNSTMAGEAWLAHVTIPADQIHEIRAELGPERAAADYATALRSVPDFDLVLLGLGADGHTASLFPGHDWGTGAGAADALAVFAAPVPPPERVSLSAARLSRAHAVLFLVEGERKRPAVSRWRSGEALPAAAIRPARGVDVLVTSSFIARGAAPPGSS